MTVMMEKVAQFFTEHILTYGVFAALGIVAAFVCALLLCFRLRQNWVRQIPMMILSLLGLVIGAKLFGMISYEAYLRKMGVTDITFKRLFDGSGIVFYGGLLGYLGSLAILFWKLLPKKRLGWDIIAVSTPLFHAVARIGCYFGHESVNGELVWQPCCYGIKLDNAFCRMFWDSRLPTQLIESAFNFTLFGVLLYLILSNRKEEKRGNRIFLYLTIYPVFRFLIEFFRGDEVRGGYGFLSFSQVVSLIILLFVAIYLLLRKKGYLRIPPVDPYDPEVEKFDLFAKPQPEPIGEVETDNRETEELSGNKD